MLTSCFRYCLSRDVRWRKVESEGSFPPICLRYPQTLAETIGRFRCAAESVVLTKGEVENFPHNFLGYVVSIRLLPEYGQGECRACE